jgi:asparagine synthase (glutamine-hydrolysing)
MCGLVGLLSDTPRNPGELELIAGRMAGTITHRGPDDSGTWMAPGGQAAFGFRRLSILDLSAAGHQPMASSSGRYTVVYNGELYNHLEVRRELGEGIRWRGHSDTETLLAGFERWGIRATVERLGGMFAIAAWDAERSELTLARDRLGKKPLYIHRSTGLVAFASELRAFREIPGFAPTVDPDALAAYLRYLYVPAPLTIFREVRKLLPGHLLTLRDAGAADLTGTRYWSAEDAARRGQAAPWRGTGEEAVGALDALLGEAVSQRLLSDVPVGALLSGGIDSSLVVGMMAERAAGSVRTYAVAFPESGFDESSQAREVADRFGTTHTTFDLSTGDLTGVVPRLPDIFDEPNADPSCVPTYLICALARQDVTVALTGDGGDEMFGGYNRYTRGVPLVRAAGLLPYALRRRLMPGAEASVVRGLAGTFGGGGRQQSGRSRGERMGRLLREPSVSAMYQQLVTTRSSVSDLVPAGEVAPLHPAHVLDDASLPLAERMMLFDQLVYLPDDLLAKLDRASMAASLEARAPLLDHRVAEFAWRLPLRHKIRRRKGKWLLRELLARRLPREVFERPKMGFSPPVGPWLRGPLRPWAEDLLLGGPHSDLLDQEAVRRTWLAFRDGDAETELLVWALALYRAWERRWTGSAAAPTSNGPLSG